MRIFAAQSGIWENPRIALVKSSLVFVLVEGCRLAALKFLARSSPCKEGGLPIGSPQIYITPIISSTDWHP